MNQATRDGWVDETFGGHTQLAVLALPSLSEPAIERILSHLSGLVELTVDRLFDMSTRLLAALARSCPGLQVLRCFVSQTAKLSALAPLSGVIKELAIEGDLSSAESLTALVRTLSAVTSLKLPSCPPPASLKPIASHLTSFNLKSCCLCEEFLPGPWLCRLEALALDLRHDSHLALPRLLAANQATLRSLDLRHNYLTATEVPSLAASLCALPHLVHLELFVPNTGGSLSTLLPPDLVDRLERLNLVLCRPATQLRITSSHLQHLRAVIDAAPDSELSLHCPALVELELSGVHCRLIECPRLRKLMVPVGSLAAVASVTLPDLEDAVFSEVQRLAEDPVGLLTGSPWLQVLTSVRLTSPDLLARLCASGSLIRLGNLHLDVTRLPNPLVLRLPGQLEHLDLTIEMRGHPSGPQSPLDLQVEAPGLLSYCLTITDQSLPSTRVRLSRCPNLVCLRLESPPAVLLSLQVDDNDDGAIVTMQPRSLYIHGRIEMVSLLGLLTRHGARLREIVSWWDLRPATSADWPQLMGALSGLPRLTSLEVNVSGASSPLSLACPQLRRLVLDELSAEVKVVLACPLLESLRGIKSRSRQLVLALPAPSLRHH
ncbi:hypothetical protein PAPYR_500 [Paratrimastix pyriformis]|uniref:Uncharacterized protein n=1 Tax=Paratrimastix pyriformis TaxID=342808 RepID=A0ABQ8UVT1_9EUKA|nr:hypothetical protein PAPYR_500 [Paratrimastix pyriformis]